MAEDKLCLIRISGWPLSYTVHEAILRKTEIKIRIKNNRDFTGGAVVKNPPANAGDTGSSPGPGRSHMPWSN